RDVLLREPDIVREVAAVDRRELRRGRHTVERKRRTVLSNAHVHRFARSPADVRIGELVIDEPAAFPAVISFGSENEVVAEGDLGTETETAQARVGKILVVPIDGSLIELQTAPELHAFDDRVRL